MTVEPDKADAVYHKGDTVTFTIDLQDNKQPVADGTTVDYIISKDGLTPPLDKGTVTLTGGKATVTGKLNEPGFLRIDATYKKDKLTITAPTAAAIDPFDIKPSMPVPDDFDAFWAEKKKALEAVPLNATLTPVPCPANRPGLETFDIKADCIGAPMSGMYARPTGAKPKSCPAMLYVEGAGVRSAEVEVACRPAQKGYLSLDLNAHGILNGQPKAYYDGLANGDLKDYRTHGRESRDTYYFLGMYLRVQRALDFLCAQPEWDGKTLVIQGVSQGGGQAIAGAALDPRVTFLFAGFPAQCDHTGMVANRIAGWPKLVTMGADGKPDPAILQASRYFDTVNFASRVKCPCHFWIGYVDSVTPPTASYAAYNSVPGPKEITGDPDHGHGRDSPILWPSIAAIVYSHAGVGPQSDKPASVAGMMPTLPPPTAPPAPATPDTGGPVPPAPAPATGQAPAAASNP